MWRLTRYQWKRAHQCVIIRPRTVRDWTPDNMNDHQRPYDQIKSRLLCDGLREQRMQVFVDAVWNALHDQGVSWVGFYLDHDNDELVLGPCRNKPACSPIGMHGACGQSFRSGEPLVVRDVADLGAEYIACDPRDRSEVVIPLSDTDGRRWGVLDVDSFEVGAFSDHDVTGLLDLLRAAQLTT